MKKKIAIIIGIVIIIAGLGLALYPVITNAVHKHQQKEMLKEVKSQILQAANSSNNVKSEGKPSKPIDFNIDIEDIDYENMDEDESGRPIFFFDEETTPKPDESEPDNSEAKENTETGKDENNNVTPEPSEDTPTPSPTPIPHRDEAKYETDRLYGQEIVGIIESEKIDLIYALVEGVEDWNIGVAIGHFPGTAMPGEVGNCCLAGHNGGRYGRYFGDIVDLESDDEILVTTLDGLVYTYKVKQKFIVEPTDVYILDDVDSTSRVLTLVTCTNHGKQRLIVRAYCTTGPSYYTGE